ncbi:hypothetical protein ACFVWY_24945, partial [Streptomyces sp. NPDC058195]
AKGAGAGLSKIGDITKGLKGISGIEIPKLPDGAVTLPEGSLKLPDGTFHLPEGAKIPEGGVKLPDGNIKFPDDTPVLPENTTKLPTHTDSPGQYFDPDGNLLNKDGNVVQHAADAPREPTPHLDNAHPDLQVKEPALVGAGTHTAENVAHVGDDAFGGTSHSSDPRPGGGGSGHGGDGPSHPGGDGPQEPRPPHHGDTPDPERVPDEPNAHGPDEPNAHGPDDHRPASDAADGPSAHDPAHVPGDATHALDLDDMGTRRDYEARTSPESTIAVPPKEPGDIVLDTGDPVYFRDGRTAVGYDSSTLINFDLVQPLPGHHDVVVHGNNEGYFLPGRVNEAGVGFPAPATHPTHIAEAIRANPSYDGGPVRLVSCHTGTVTAEAKNIPAGQAVANELGVTVMAPTNKVGVNRKLGPNQVPKIFDEGYWETFYPKTS